MTGERAASIPQTTAEKLKGLYNQIRQFYFGSCEVIKATRGRENGPSTMGEVLGQLSTAPKWLELWKRSSCRAGAMHMLALVKSYYPSLDPAPLVKGFPQFNADGTPFNKKSYGRVVKQTRSAATKIANSLDLSSFKYGYDSNDEKVLEEDPPRVDLLPSYKDSHACKTAGPSSSTPIIPPPGRANPDDDEGVIFESLLAVTQKPVQAGDQGTSHVGDPAPAAQGSNTGTEELPQM